MGKNFCDKLNVENVIFKNEDVFFGYGFPHYELLGIFLPVDELKSLLKISKISMSVC